ncbi:MAG: hypothetical protein F6K39_43865 [Okeania sp. SIO3B3]|nr:hypothetical protein [Okeania sp. SIO3B3]
MTDASPQQNQAALVQLMQGMAVSQSLYVVAKLGLADLLKEGPQHCDDLAATTNTHSDTLYRLLRALAGINVFTEVAPQTFATTPLAVCLQRDASNSLRDFIILRG